MSRGMRKSKQRLSDLPDWRVWLSLTNVEVSKHVNATIVEERSLIRRSSGKSAIF